MQEVQRLERCLPLTLRLVQRVDQHVLVVRPGSNGVGTHPDRSIHKCTTPHVCTEGWHRCRALEQASKGIDIDRWCCLLLWRLWRLLRLLWLLRLLRLLRLLEDKWGIGITVSVRVRIGSRSCIDRREKGSKLLRE